MERKKLLSIFAGNMIIFCRKIKDISKNFLKAIQSNKWVQVFNKMKEHRINILYLVYYQQTVHI